MSAEAAKVLRDAAQYIRDHGLHKGSLGAVNGPCCTVGAVFIAAGDYTDRGYFVSGGLADRLWGVLNRKVSKSTVQGWNDAPERTADDVIALLERVADEQAVQS